MPEVSVDIMAAPKVGAFGKMPGLGDFFRLNASEAFVSRWDDWLQTQIVTLRDTLGDRWTECYLSAPIWRFTLSAGVAGAPLTAGILMSSVDRVGRQFPLTLMTQFDPGGDVLATHTALGSLFENLEEIALGALDEDWPKDRLQEVIADVDWAVPDTGASRVSLEKNPIRVLTDETCTPEIAIASALVAGRYTQPCVWSATTPLGTHLFASDGLPTDQIALGLYDLSPQIWGGLGDD